MTKLPLELYQFLQARIKWYGFRTTLPRVAECDHPLVCNEAFLPVESAHMTPSSHYTIDQGSYIH